MSPAQSPGLTWRPVVPPRIGPRVRYGGGTTLVVLGGWAIAAEPTPRSPSTWVGAAGIVLFGLGWLVMFGLGARRSHRWSSMGLVIDDSGITIGPREPVDDAVASLLPAQALQYHAPWEAVYDAVVVTDPQVMKRMTSWAWLPGPRAGSGPGEVAARPPFFAGHVPSLMFRVDLRRAAAPALPDGVAVSHVWVVPIRDDAEVRRVFATHGVPLTETMPPAWPRPTDPRALDPAAFAAWLADPVLVNDRHPQVHRHFSGPTPRNLAEYEAACVLEHGEERRPTEELDEWEEERWLGSVDLSDVIRAGGRARLAREYRRFRREQKRRR